MKGLQAVVVPALVLALPAPLGAQAGDPPPPPDTILTAPAAPEGPEGLEDPAAGGWWHALGGDVTLVDHERFVFVGARWTRFDKDALGFDVTAGLAPRFLAASVAVLGLELDFVAPGPGPDSGVLVRPVWGVTGLGLVGEGLLLVPAVNVGVLATAPATAGERIRFDLRTRIWGVGDGALTTWSVGVGLMWRRRRAPRRTPGPDPGREATPGPGPVGAGAPSSGSGPACTDPPAPRRCTRPARR